MTALLRNLRGDAFRDAKEEPMIDSPSQPRKQRHLTACGVRRVLIRRCVRAQAAKTIARGSLKV
eukprot:273185-Pleurochrysis_carterae.AAC.1